MGAMTPTPSAGAPSPFPSIANWRDLGYWIGFDEKIVRPGVVYRTNDFAEISDAVTGAPGTFAATLRGIASVRSGRVLWASALCWAVMYTAFMVALTLATVANVLVTMAIGPMVTALFSRLFLGQLVELGLDAGAEVGRPDVGPVDLVAVERGGAGRLGPER